MPVTPITVTEAAKRAGVSSSTIIRWCRSGDVNYKVAGVDRHFMVHPGSLDKHIAHRSGAVPDGFMLLTTAASKYGMAESTLRKRYQSGAIEHKKIRNRVYVNESQVMAYAKDYDPEAARRDNGRRSAAMVGESRKPKPSPKQRAISPREMEHMHTLAFIENIVYDKKRREAME